jgi:hypothetical protein
LVNEDETPDPLAQLDQALAEMATMAKLLRAHYCAMIAAGFAVEQAIALTLSYQATIVASQLSR